MQVLESLPDDEGFTCAVKSKPRVMHRKESGAHRGPHRKPVIAARYPFENCCEYTHTCLVGTGRECRTIGDPNLLLPMLFDQHVELDALLNSGAHRKCMRAGCRQATHSEVLCGGAGDA